MKLKEMPEMLKLFLFLVILPMMTNGFVIPKPLVTYHDLSLTSSPIGKDGAIRGLNKSDKNGTLTIHKLAKKDNFHNIKANGHEHHNGRALHQLEHRAKEKASIAIVENVIKSTAGKSGKRALERVGERAAERVGERAVERAGERAIGRAAEKVGETTLERTGKKLVEKATERAVDRALERTIEISGERAIERAAEKVGERAFERTGEKLAERAAERTYDAIAERVAERAMEHATERAGERVAERAGERIAERSGERIVERAGEQVVSGKGSGRAIERIFGVSSKNIFPRLGRGALITLPVLGGIFAIYLLKSDVQRLKEEWKLNIRTSSACFFGSGLADCIDSFLHFFIAFALWNHLSHTKLAIAEELSFGCAIFSTVCAVLGEIISLRTQKRWRASVEAGEDAVASNAPLPHNVANG